MKTHIDSDELLAVTDNSAPCFGWPRTLVTSLDFTVIAVNVLIEKVRLYFEFFHRKPMKEALYMKSQIFVADENWFYPISVDVS